MTAGTMLTETAQPKKHLEMEVQ